jgi:hypothetical protein
VPPKTIAMLAMRAGASRKKASAICAMPGTANTAVHPPLGPAPGFLTISTSLSARSAGALPHPPSGWPPAAWWSCRAKKSRVFLPRAA